MFVRLLALALFACAFVLVPSFSVPVAHANGAPITYIVNSPADTDDGSCNTSPDCTLREAINASNTLTTTDTITFDIPNTDAGCASANHCTITLGSELPFIEDDVTIDGAPNGGDITVSGDDNDRVMYVSANVTINALTIVHGKCDCNGAGIFSGADDTTLNVTNSTFKDNSLVNGGTGGAIYSAGNNATLNVTNSTFSDNTIPPCDTLCSNQGGAIGISSGGTLHVTNSTFSGNRADQGGAIYTDYSTTILKNSIIANSPSGGNCYNNSGTITADSHNLADDNTCDSATQETLAQIKLGALADNGGPTQTMALDSGSAALDAGDDAVCAAATGSPDHGAGGKDQRGVARPQGSHCDVGAFEAGLVQGQKFNDANGNGAKNGDDDGIPGWTIKLLDTGNTLLDSTTTDATGNYTFTVGALPFTYRIREEPQNGWTQTTANPADVALTLASPGASGVDFGNFEKVSISGTKFNDLDGSGTQDPGDPGLAGWTIHLEDTSNNVLDTVVTGANGAFSFTNVGPGTYRVREVNQNGWVQTTANPADATVMSGQNVSGILFGNSYQADVSIVKAYKTKNNGDVLFTLTVTNAGPGKAKKVVVTDVVPDLWLYASANTTRGACEYDATGGKLTCKLGKLKLNANAVITLVMHPPKSDNGFTNCADVKSKTYDPDPSNNESCVSRPQP